jgi:hypothetical protein
MRKRSSGRNRRSIGYQRLKYHQRIKKLEGDRRHR